MFLSWVVGLVSKISDLKYQQDTRMVHFINGVKTICGLDMKILRNLDSMVRKMQFYIKRLLYVLHIFVPGKLVMMRGVLQQD